MEIIDYKLLDKVTSQAKESARLRMNYNFHTSLEDPINRLLNAVEPETYFPPHRHLNPTRGESFIILRGSVLVFIFDDEGNITFTTELSPTKGMYGMELDPGVWHSLIVLETGTVVYEVKEGPYVPLSPENIAPWAPDSAKKEEVTAYMNLLRDEGLQRIG